MSSYCFRNLMLPKDETEILWFDFDAECIYSTAEVRKKCEIDARLAVVFHARIGWYVLTFQQYGELRDGRLA